MKTIKRVCFLIAATTAISTGCKSSDGGSGPSKPVTKLAFLAQPGAAEVGVAFQNAVEVALQDEQGNTVTGDDRDVSIVVSASVGPVALSGVTTVHSQNGVATFPGVSVSGSGDDLTLLASSAGLTSATSAPFSVHLTFVQLTTGGSGHTCALSLGGLAMCWGRNVEGQIGDGTTVNKYRPTLVGGGLTFRQLSAGMAHTCGLTTNGDAYCWGKIGSEAIVPTLLPGGLNFVELNGNDYHVCGVTTTNTAYCWGDNGSGQLGDGTTTPHVAPTLVAGSWNAAHVSTGTFHSCGLDPDGVAYCWGANSLGQLGDGGTDSHLTPLPVDAGSLRFVQIATGFQHNCALTAAHEVYCWGLILQGAPPAFPSALAVPTPTLLDGGVQFVQLSAGGFHSCGLAVNHEVQCWGRNELGQLGDGTYSPRAEPAPVSGSLTFDYVSTGYSHTCGITTDHVVYCWGSNINGQLGDGTNTGSATPVQIVP